MIDGKMKGLVAELQSSERIHGDERNGHSKTLIASHKEEDEE